MLLLITIITFTVSLRSDAFLQANFLMEHPLPLTVLTAFYRSSGCYALFPGWFLQNQVIFFGVFLRIVWFSFDFMHEELSMNVLTPRIIMEVLFIKLLMIVFVVIIEVVVTYFYGCNLFAQRRFFNYIYTFSEIWLSTGSWPNLPVFLMEKSKISRF